MLRISLIYAALILAGAFTINAYWIDLSGAKTIEIFNRLPVLFAPSDYVYLLFIVIIVVNFIFFMTYGNVKQSIIFTSNLQIALYFCNSLVHIIVLYIWHENQFMSATILQGALVLLSFSLFLTFPLTKTQVHYRTPITLFFSWHLFIFLFMINTTIVNYEWYGLGISNSLWTVIFLTIGCLIVLYLKYEYSDRISSIVFIWCYIGVAYANGFNALLVTTAALFLSGVMLVGIWFINKKRELA
jgi:hypothetical protein